MLYNVGEGHESVAEEVEFSEVLASREIDLVDQGGRHQVLKVVANVNLNEMKMGFIYIVRVLLLHCTLYLIFLVFLRLHVMLLKQGLLSLPLFSHFNVCEEI